MSTYMPKAGDITRKWYVIDAAGKPLGKVAVQAAVLLRGKHKPTFTPHADCGDHVIIINAEKAVLTGNKLNQKMYYHHTGYIGNMKEVKYSTLMKTKPEFAVELAVKRNSCRPPCRGPTRMSRPTGKSPSWLWPRETKAVFFPRGRSLGCRSFFQRAKTL